MMSSGVRVRFAPSPTGPLHAGNMRTAVFNWLFAKKMNGAFVLRIEDTDSERSSEEYSREIIDSMEWLGIEFDEGPHYQSERTEIYARIADTFLSRKLLYPCFCTEEQLEEDRKIAEKRGRPPIYAGRCSKIEEGEGMRRMAKEPFSLRFRITGDNLTYLDAIRGETTFNLRLFGDFIVMRSNGTVTYNFAAAIDDLLMKISHVIRGEDHMSNTPKQILLIQAMGGVPPVYAHLPLILADDGTKLSKRHRQSSFSSLIHNGYLPEAVLNFLSLIGWHPEDNREEMAVGDIITSFSLDRVAVRASHYNLQKLDWLNKQKIRSAQPERLLTYGAQFIHKHRTAFDKLPEEKKLYVLTAAKENIARLNELETELEPFFSFNLEPDTVSTMIEYPACEVVGALISHCGTRGFKDASDAVSAQTGVKGKALFMSIRAGLTGKLHGAELSKIYEFLSPDEKISRLNAFLEQMTK